MRGLRADTLGWGVSLYCLVIGTLMLITPHQFASRTFLPLQPVLPWTGSGLLIAGAALLVAVTLAPPPWVRAAAFIVVGGALLALAGTFFSTGAWTGLTSYLVLGLGTLLGAALSGRADDRQSGRDLFALTMGLASALTGFVMLALPGQFQSPSYNGVRPWLGWHGAAFLVTGCLLVVAWLRWPRRQGLVRLAHALAGAASLAFCLTFAIPNRGLPALALYGGLGIYLALLPYLASVLRAISPTRLQTHLTLALMALAAVPLISATAVITGQEERQASELALARQRALAATLATSTHDYVQFHAAAMTSLAAELGAAPLDAPQASTLARFQGAFPSFAQVATFDRDGVPVAGANGRPAAAAAGGQRVYEETRRTGGPTIEVRTTGTVGLPVAAIGVAIERPPGRFAGLAVGSLAMRDLSAKLAQTAALDSGEVYLVDGEGRVIAHPNPIVAHAFSDRSNLAPVAALLASGQAGMLGYQDGDGAQLAGFAPIPGLGWGVVVDRPAAAVLAGVRSGRELALGVLLTVLGVAFFVSLLLSRLLAVPLAALVQVMRRLTAGEPVGRMPASQIDEVASLTSAFAALRDELAHRTAERDRADARLRLLADASGALATSLDERAILSHVIRLLAPGMADWCGVLLVGGPGELRLAASAAGPDLVSAGQPEPAAAEALRHAAIALEFGETMLVAPRERAAEGPGAGDPADRDAGPLSATIVVPLTSETGQLGALVLARLHGGKAYSAEELEVACELARRITVALAHARLYVQEQQARAEAEAAVAVRDRFLATAAHELKTPLTPLLGQAQLLQRRIDRGVVEVERDRRSAAVIVAQAHRLNRLVGSLLDLERLRSGRIELSLASVDLAALVSRLAGELEPTLTNHTLSVEIPPEPVLVPGDELRLEQVLLNLLQNALKYSPDGGQVTIRILLDGGRVGVEVSDQGIGIPEAEIARVFNPFYRSAAAERGAVPGLGVGLALVNEIVTLHSGSVTVSSTEGVGSTFTIWLPTAGPLRQSADGEELTALASAQTPSPEVGGHAVRR